MYEEEIALTIKELESAFHCNEKGKKIIEVPRIKRVMNQLKNHLKPSKYVRLKDYSARVLIAGEIRVGKSSLINSIIEHDNIKLKAHTDPLFPDTMQISKYRNSENCLELYDTPGINEGILEDDRHMQEMTEVLKDVDLILFLMPYTFSGGDYEKTMDFLVDYAGEEAIKKRTAFAISKSDVLRPILKERHMTEMRYKDEYAFRLNKTVFRNMKYKIDPEEIQLVSIHRENEIDELLVKLLTRVSDFGIAGLLEFIKKNEIVDQEGNFLKRLIEWVVNMISDVSKAVLIKALSAAMFL